MIDCGGSRPKDGNLNPVDLPAKEVTAMEVAARQKVARW